MHRSHFDPAQTAMFTSFFDFDQMLLFLRRYPEGIIHPHGVAMFKHILVPTDGSKLSLKALDLAAELATSTGAQVSVLHVAPTFPTMIGGDGYMVSTITPKQWEVSIEKHTAHVRALAEKRAQAKSIKVQFLSVAVDQPYVGIIDVAKRKKCDVIVMTSHGRKGISALLIGSETTKVLTHCKIPVLVCR